jgi:hypothetical protein
MTYFPSDLALARADNNTILAAQIELGATEACKKASEIRGYDGSVYDKEIQEIVEFIKEYEKNAV